MLDVILRALRYSYAKASVYAGRKGCWFSPIGEREYAHLLHRR